MGSLTCDLITVRRGPSSTTIDIAGYCMDFMPMLIVIIIIINHQRYNNHPPLPPHNHHHHYYYYHKCYLNMTITIMMIYSIIINDFMYCSNTTYLFLSITIGPPVARVSANSYHNQYHNHHDHNHHFYQHHHDYDHRHQIYYHQHYGLHNHHNHQNLMTVIIIMMMPT